MILNSLFVQMVSPDDENLTCEQALLFSGKRHSVAAREEAVGHCFAHSLWRYCTVALSRKEERLIAG